MNQTPTHSDYETVIKKQRLEIKQLRSEYAILQNTIEELLRKKKEQEEKNKALQEQIDEMLLVIQSSEKEIEKARRNSTINEMKIEPKIYLKGMFESFDKERAALKILVEGEAYYYPLEAYRCRHLPVSGARVLLFRNEEGSIAIYGFDVAKLIEPSLKVKGEIKFASSAQNRLKLYIPEHGYISFSPGSDFWERFSYRIGDTLILNKIFIDTEVYFTIDEKGNGNVDRAKILQMMLEESE